jgi:hypothetical protein
VQRTGRDVGPEREAKQDSKVLHLPARSRFGEGRAAPPHVNCLQSKTLTAIDHLQAVVTFTLSNNRICKTLEIFLPARLPEFFPSFMGMKEDYFFSSEVINLFKVAN